MGSSYIPAAVPAAPRIWVRLRAVYFSSSLAAGPPFAIYNPASALNIALLTPHYRTIAST